MKKFIQIKNRIFRISLINAVYLKDKSIEVIMATDDKIITVCIDFDDVEKAVEAFDVIVRDLTSFRV